MFSIRILLTLMTAAAAAVRTVKAERLFEFADKLRTQGIKECDAKGIGECSARVGAVGPSPLSADFKT